MKKNQAGLGILEVMIASSVLAGVIVASMSYFQGQTKSLNHLEFVAKREQLRIVLLGQFLNDDNNCKCLMAGAAQFPVSGTNVISGISPTVLGRFNFVTPGNCSTASVPAPFVSDTGVDFMKLTSVRLENVVNISGVYQGQFAVTVKSMKKVSGPDESKIMIPVGLVTTAGAPGMRALVSCSMRAVSATATPEIMACQGSCGGSWPNVIGAIAQYNWARNDGTFYHYRGPACSTALAWTSWNPGGACSDGGCRNGNALFLCSK